jgi:thioredoxin-like negative regulator of GroEL
MEEWRDAELESILERMARRLAEGKGDSGRVKLIESARDFDRAICSRRVVVALFTSPTCPACEMYRPIFYEAARRAARMFSGRVAFIEVDVYSVPEKAYELGVMSTPTTVVFVDCKPVDGFVGIADVDELIGVVRSYVG